jgi:hypothetical protein
MCWRDLTAPPVLVARWATATPTRGHYLGDWVATCDRPLAGDREIVRGRGPATSDRRPSLRGSPFFVFCPLFFHTSAPPPPSGTFGQLIFIGSSTCPPCPEFT